MMKRVTRVEAHRQFFSSALVLGTMSALGIGLCALIVFVWFPNYRGEQALLEAQHGVSLRLGWLAQQGDEVARLEPMRQALRSGQYDSVYALLKSERDARRVGLMGVTDRNGYILARTRTVKSLGDNVFLTAPLGRALAAGKTSAAAIEISDIDTRQVLFNTGRFVMDGDVAVGAVFANFLADDTFAERFASEFLRQGEYIAFYTKQYGIYGSNFRSDGARALHALVHPDSELIRSTQDSVRITLPDGSQYLIRNVRLAGMESADTGMLVFIPVTPVWILQLILAAIPIVFLVLSWMAHASRWPHERKHYFGVLLVGGALVLGLLSLLEYDAIRNSFVVLRSPGYTLYNSTLRFQPKNVVMSTRYTKNFSVVVDSGGEPVNAFGIHIVYDPELIRVTALDISRSICTDFITKDLDQVHGKIDIECGVRAKGYDGPDGEIASITVQGLSESMASLHFADTTQVLAADGLGTDVLRLAQDASLVFDDAAVRGATRENPLFYSPSHPNSEWWYASTSVELVWQPRTELSLRLYRVPLEGDDELVGSYSGLPSPLETTVPADGVYEFKAQDTQGVWKSVYRVRVDTTPPQKVEFVASETSIGVGGLVRFLLTATDTSSTLQRTAYVRLDEGVFYPFANMIYVPFKVAGKHEVTARVFDKAGNTVDASITVLVR